MFITRTVLVTKFIIIMKLQMTANMSAHDKSYFFGVDSTYITRIGSQPQTTLLAIVPGNS